MPKGEKGGCSVQAKHRILVAALVLAALLGQGVRWVAQSGGVFVPQLETSVSTQGFEENRHCSLVHINTAGVAELQTLPGIGPVYAQRIAEARQEQPFTKPDDLLKVSGIGPKRLEALVGLVCFYIPDDK